MAEKQSVTAKNFGTKLAGATRSIKTASANLQELLAFAGQDYLDNGDSGFLKKLVNACVGVQGLATGKMIGYIVESSDLKCVSVEIKSGTNAGKKERVFKREQSGSKVARTFKLPAYDWTQWMKPDEAVTLKDIDESIKNLIKSQVNKLAQRKGADKQHTLKRLTALASMVGAELVIDATKEKKAA